MNILSNLPYSIFIESVETNTQKQLYTKLAQQTIKPKGKKKKKFVEPSYVN